MCSRRTESHACEQMQKWYHAHFEEAALLALVRIFEIEPRRGGAGAAADKAAERRAALLVEIKTLDAKVADYFNTESVTMKAAVEHAAAEADAKRREAEKLTEIARSADERRSRLADVHRYIRQEMAPALKGDAKARMRLRSRLSRFEFSLRGLSSGHMELLADGQTILLDPPELEDDVRNEPVAALPGLIGKKRARTMGLTKYKTGKPCRNGHVAERSVFDGKCVECRVGLSKRYREKNAVPLASRRNFPAMPAPAGQPIVSLREARQRGLSKYFTGMPCSNGHLAFRSTSTTHCAVCRAELHQRKTAGRARVRKAKVWKVLVPT